MKAGQSLANWDPLTRPIITEYAGETRFENVEEGVTVAKQIDETTGLSSLVVIDPKRRGTSATKGLRPAVKLVGDKGKEVKLAGGDTPVNYTFQIGAIITVKNGQQVNVGDVLARIPQESSKTRDITGACRAWRSSSRRARRRTRACSRKSPARCRSARTRRASSAWSSPTSTASRTST